MQRNILPPFVAIALTKSQFCFCTGISPYKLRQTLLNHYEKYRRLGYNRFDKLLMPAVVHELLAETGLRINMDYYQQYIDASHAMYTQIANEQ